MINRFALLLPALLAAFSPAMGGDSTLSTPIQRFRFLPGAPLPLRLTAHQQEPRTGIGKEVGSSRLKLDIGAGYDILELRPCSDAHSVVRIGVEFFTYALTTSADGFRLQVDAVDGFFGGHAHLMLPGSAGTSALRLRIMHLSSHAVDGHLSPATGTWRDGRAPIPYTRDFGELTALRRWESSSGHVQAYGGAAYATLIRPATLERWSFHAGGEIVDRRLIPRVFGRAAQIYVAAHFGLQGIPTWVGTVDVESGIRMGEWDEGGMRVYGSFRSGSELFAQYYDLRTRAFALGISFDLW